MKRFVFGKCQGPFTAKVQMQKEMQIHACTHTVKSRAQLNISAVLPFSVLDKIKATGEESSTVQQETKNNNWIVKDQQQRHWLIK